MALDLHLQAITTAGCGDSWTTCDQCVQRPASAFQSASRFLASQKRAAFLARILVVLAMVEPS
jgi:hypothetical protein